ncbi:MAG: hypothetical protein WCJ67_03515 [Thermoleophilia bacterium]
MLFPRFRSFLAIRFRPSSVVLSRFAWRLPDVLPCRDLVAGVRAVVLRRLAPTAPEVA